MGDVTLQPQTISTVKATAPVLREHGLEITRRMYELLFQDEQIKSLFNQSHHRGVGTQPRSLAGAVHAYAANIDRLDELGPVGSRQRHLLPAEDDLELVMQLAAELLLADPAVVEHRAELVDQQVVHPLSELVEHRVATVAHLAGVALNLMKALVEGHVDPS